MEVNPQSVAAFTELITNPAAHGFDFKPIKECFKPSETVTPNHILFEQYRNYIGKDLPKFFFYIIMIDLYGQCDGKSTEGGYLGYHLQLAID